MAERKLYSLIGKIKDPITAAVKLENNKNGSFGLLVYSTFIVNKLPQFRFNPRKFSV